MSMTGQQLNEWMAFAGLEPFGEERADLRMGILAAATVNAMTRTKDSDPVAKAEDFMPKFDPTPDPSPFSQNENGEGSEDAVTRKIDAYFSALASVKN